MYTRVIYTDATTAEAATTLKNHGFLESSQGGLFTCPSISANIYVVWGRSTYYPELSAQLDFMPRIQIHIKSRENGAELAELTIGTVNGLRGICPSNRIRVFNADALQEIDC